MDPEPARGDASASDSPPPVLLKASQAHRPGPIRHQGKKRKADRSTTASSDALTVGADKKAPQKTKKKRAARKPKVQETDRPAITFADELGARGVALLEQFDQVDALYCVLVVSVQC